MNILWTEDFGGPLAPSKIVVEIFKGLFENGILRKEYDQDNEDVAGQLASLFSKHTLHEIHVCKSYVDWKQTYEKHNGDFDIVLIDINLESYPTPESEMPGGIYNPHFDKKAGFHIYHQLIKRGFPDDNIAFFTGEGQTLEEFTKYCRDIFLERPQHCFEKNPARFENPRQWLVDKANQRSLILRRGIIEGCRFMKERVKAFESSDLESRLLFYKTTLRNINNDRESFRSEILDYLTRLERFFTFGNADLRYLFVKELAAKWDESSWNFVKVKDAPRFKSRLEERFYKTTHFQMKMLRNWCAHGLLNPNVLAKDVAYFFILMMRLLIDSDMSEIFKYERLLSGLFTKLSDLEINRQINSSLEFHLEQSYGKLRALHQEALRYLSEEPRDRRTDNNYLAMFKELGESPEKLNDRNVFELFRRKIKDISLELFYHSYWHGLFPSWVKSTLYAKLQSVRFNVEPLPQPSFLSFLGELIFQDCFGDESLSVKSEQGEKEVVSAKQ